MKFIAFSLCEIKRRFGLLLILYGQIGFSQNTLINSGWQFSSDKTQWETVNIPHNWNTHDAFDDEPGYYRGLGYYKKQLYFSNELKNKVHYLKFNAVNQECTICQWNISWKPQRWLYGI